MKKLSGRKIQIVIMVIIIFLSVLIDGVFYNKRGTHKEILKENMGIINRECTIDYENVDNEKEKYTKLLEDENDYFKKGMYCSVLSRIYKVYNDAEQVKYYSEQAVGYYKKVTNGIYYSINQKRYLALAMLDMGLYPDCFNITSELLQDVESANRDVFDESEINDTEALVYAMFINIYCDLDVPELAKEYYEKLCEITDDNNNDQRIVYSKLIYAIIIDDSDLIQKYSYEWYDATVKMSQQNGVDKSKYILASTAIADMKSGKLDGVLDRLKTTEDAYTSINSEGGLAYVYSGYAEYYYITGDLQKADDYYKRSIDGYTKIGDLYTAITMKCKYIEFVKKSGKQDVDYGKLYKDFYEYAVKENANGTKEIGQLLSSIVKTNEQLSKSKIDRLEKQSIEKERLSLFQTIFINILIVLIIVLFFLIGKKNKTEKRLESTINKDYLTGINTRLHGRKLALDLIKRKKKFSLALLDIDNFKHINDTYGHMVGDEVLRTFTSIISEELTKNEIFVRFGGEEFIIIFIGKDKFQAQHNLNEIKNKLTNIVFKEGFSISFSAGIKEWDNTNLDNVIKQADDLLYKAKTEGKNRIDI